MNPKQIGCVILLAGILLFVQWGLSMSNSAKVIDEQTAAAKKEEETLRTQLKVETSTLADLTQQSRELLDFVQKWEPYFAVIEEQHAAETGISMKVREANMLNLSQNYQQVPHKINNKENPSLPILVRASLVFDDNFSKLLNWIGMMEKIKPTMRIGRLSLSKGSRGEDLRMEVTLEIPLRNRKK